MPKKVRIDKWLWAVRIYKTRSMATNACKSGKVKVGDEIVKPSYSLEEGMMVTARQRYKIWKVKSLRLIEKRVGAALATDCYEDHSPTPEKSGVLPSFFYRTNEKRDQGVGRPTKKDRRSIERFKDNS